MPSSNQFDLHYYRGGHDFMTASAGDILRRVQSMLNDLVPAHAIHSDRPGGPDAADTPLFTVRWVPVTSHTAAATNEALGDAYVISATDLAASSVSDDIQVALSQARLVINLLMDHKAVGPADWVDAEVAMCARLMQFVQKLLSLGVSPASRIILLLPTAAEGSMCTGFSKAVAMEEPDLQFVRIFVARESYTGVLVQEALRLSAMFPNETDLWIARHVVMAPRLLREPLAGSQSSFSLPSDCVYLVTGGRGGIGKELVSWLLADMQLPSSSVILLVRKDGQGGSSSVTGSLRTIQVDISDVEDLCSNAELSELRNIGGIFHLAGNSSPN
jgi:hypothetical protein